VDRQRHDHGPLRKLEPVPIGRGQFQALRHQVELLARHAKRGVIVNFHGPNIFRSLFVPKAEIGSPYRLGETTLPHFQANLGAGSELLHIAFEKLL
jgi:hypothetical protein